MARLSEIHDGFADDFDYSIDPAKSKNYIRNKSKSSKDASFLKAVSSAIRYANTLKTGKHLYVNNPAGASQRVLVKAHIVRHISQNKGRNSLQHHCKYITRKGVDKTKEKSPEVYSKSGTLDASQQEKFIEEASQDRHHFRFIISPENAHQLDLTSYVKEVVEQMEKDLGTKLEYIAVNHYNTDNPHAHVIIRGKDSKGKDLVISKDYISNGVRNRACEIANSHLGLRSELEIKNGITKDIDRLAFTQLDHELKKILMKSPNNTVDLTAIPKRDNSMAQFKKQALERRLEFLETLHLAKEIAPGVWKVKDDYERHLRDLGMRNDVVKTMNKCLSRGNNQEKVIFDMSSAGQKPITGKVIDIGVSDELHDSLYMVISATDNRLHYVKLPKNYQINSEIKRGSIVTVSNEKLNYDLLTSDKKMIELAKIKGKFSLEYLRIHINRHRLPGNVTVEKYLENFKKRLKTLERLHVVERAGPTSWTIPDDFEQRLAKAGKQQFRIEHEAKGLTQQIYSETPTWIDKELVEGRLPSNEVRGSEFSQELNKAKEKRLEILQDKGIAIMITPQEVRWDPEFVKKIKQPQQQKDMEQKKDQGLDR